jgi:sulfur relay (sulfurtransferase) DsrF/TusC family protein
MARYLSVIEGAYRATVEEQDDTGVWFTHAIGNAGAQVGLLLRGDGVSYAQKGQQAGGLRFGTHAVRVPPELDRDLEAMLGKGIPVYVVSEDAAARGIPPEAMLAGLRQVARAQLCQLFSEYDRVLHF